MECRKKREVNGTHTLPRSRYLFAPAVCPKLTSFIKRSIRKIPNLQNQKGFPPSVDCLLGQTFLLSVKLSMSFLRRKSQLNSRQSCNQLSKRIFSHFPPAFRYRCVWMSDGLARQASWPTPPCLGTHSLFYLMSCVGVWMCVPPPPTQTHTRICTRKHSQRPCHSPGYPLPP